MKNTQITNPKLLSFVDEGTIGDTMQRREIAYLIENWKEASIAGTCLDAPYLLLINQFLKNKKIKSYVKKHIELKEKFIERIIAGLELLHKKLNAINLSQEEAFIQQLRKMENRPFYEFLATNSCNLRQKLKQLFGPTDELCEAYRLKIDEAQKMIKNLELKICEINKRHRERKKENFEKIRLIDKQLNRIEQEKQNNENKKGLKIKGKIDLATGKWVSIEPNPLEDEAKELLALKELLIQENQRSVKGKNKRIAKKTREAKLKILQLQQDFCDELERYLVCKLMNLKEQIMEQITDEIMQAMEEKMAEIEQISQVLAPFLNGNNNWGKLWDLSAADFKKVNFDILNTYNEMIEQNTLIQEIAQRLGRYRDEETEWEEEEVTYVKEKEGTKEDGWGKSELVGIEQSDNLNQVLPYEIALFADSDTENLFFKKLIEKELQTFKFVNKVKYNYQETYSELRRKPLKKEKGPFILAIDTSGSMKGNPENVAKILSFALTKIGLEDNRPVFIISFSTSIETMEMIEFKTALPQLVQFLGSSFYGGTDASVAVAKAIEQMNTQKYENADLLIVTDGVFGHLSKHHCQAVKEMQAKGNTFNCLIVPNGYHSGYGYQQLDFCNQVWTFSGRDWDSLLLQVQNDIAA